MSFFSKKPTIWVVSDGTNSCVQSWAIARNITSEKNIIEHDRLSAHSAKKGFPDLAIGVGNGVTDTLEGIKEVSQGKTKTAVILDPLKDHETFDFIILPSYEPYHIEGENVIHSTGLANYVNKKFLQTKLKEYKKSTRYKFLREDKTLKPPYTTILIGGRHTGGNISEEDGLKIAEHINNIVSEKGGSALITTSARTEFATTRKIFENITVPHFAYDYKLRETENPYNAFLALADEIIVTGDSVRMMCEACSSGKKVRIFTPEELGFQYEPLIEELLDNKHAVDIETSSEEIKKFTPIILDTAKNIGALIKKRL